MEIQLNELEEQWHFSSLERIFIENRIYRDIEDQETWEGVIQVTPHKAHGMVSLCPTPHHGMIWI